MSNTVVRTNVLALNSHRNLGLVANQQQRASRNLSSGFRINSAADDAAGLGISESMRAQIRGLNQASRNAQDGISLVQTAEGVTSTIQEMAQRIRELAVQGANDTNSDAQRGFIANEVNQLHQEITRSWNNSTFNGQNIFAGGTAQLFAGTLNLQVGADAGTGNAIDVVAAVGTSHTTVDATISGTGLLAGAAPDHDAFQTLITNANNFINEISTLRSNLGAVQNRLEFTIQAVDIASENLSASESRVRDADMAAEMMRLTQANVLQQAATAMLAQANQTPQSILQLVR